MLKISEILKATKGEVLNNFSDFQITGISIDSRTIKEGELFIAIKGNNFDGHDFIREAILKGARAIIFDNPFKIENISNIPVIKVNNSKTALGDIARYFRSLFKCETIAVTGSNGKTTVKELISFLLSKKYKVVKAKESYNNDIGVPLTILQLKKDTQFLILEMEMNQLGGIKTLCEIAKPNIGVITNIGDSHLEFLKDRNGVAKEKSELLEYLTPEGVAILNNDDPIIKEMSKRFFLKKIFFGIKNKNCEIFANPLELNKDKTKILLLDKIEIELPLIGIHNIYNFLAALSVIKALNLDIYQFLDLKDFQPPSLRTQIYQLKNISVILDCYNANPSSMESALETLKTIFKKERKIGVLGDMKELGEKSEEFHYQLGEKSSKILDILFFYGDYGEIVKKGFLSKKRKEEDFYYFSSKDKLVAKLIEILREGDIILIKGSRILKMEEIFYKLKEYYGEKNN
ncbi:MAG: UDP-N-acetylmuramoyl-tripeptide--D-alanyl-D-alanine ligase [candidate division WOR-3 bacterium]|nr:UDP-N-acetylmuramoyl-tripeptide--D-alanyl-D-alanine ligase [candidate division WOR-3 bacterium]